MHALLPRPLAPAGSSRRRSCCGSWAFPRTSVSRQVSTAATGALPGAGDVPVLHRGWAARGMCHMGNVPKFKLVRYIRRFKAESALESGSEDAREAIESALESGSQHKAVETHDMFPPRASSLTASALRPAYFTCLKAILSYLRCAGTLYSTYFTWSRCSRGDRRRAHGPEPCQRASAAVSRICADRVVEQKSTAEEQCRSSGGPQRRAR